MTRQLRYATQAIDDLNAIGDFIAEQSGSEDIAEHFAVQLDDRCRRLASLPGILVTGRPELASGIRSTPHKAYVIFFRYSDEELEIVTIVHGSRDVEHLGLGLERENGPD